GLENPTQLAAGTSLFIAGAEHELPVPPAAVEQAFSTRARRHSPSSITRAGGRPLDPAAHGEPLTWPAPGVLISGFGERERDRHGTASAFRSPRRDAAAGSPGVSPLTLLLARDLARC